VSDEYVFEIDGSRVTATPFAAGPWDPTMQHGGAPTALVARAAEAFPAARPMRVARMTVDLLRPVPVATLDIETEVVRASVLKLRSEPQDLPEHRGFRPLEFDVPEAGEPRSPGFNPHGFGSGLSTKLVRGEWGQPGPAAVWFRMDRAMVRGEATTPLMRAALTADFCNGVSSVVDFRKWTYINGDLSVNFARDPVGDWILLDAETWVGDSGGAMAFARLADRDGYFGRAVQSVLIEKRG
jgi:hypothetical protein